jgi:nitrogen fixation NifU-like protein
MSYLSELYQEVILDHTKRPRNHGRPEHFDRKVEGFNPLCGDRFTIYLALDGETIREAAFDGAGCAISTASASMMTESVTGKTLGEAADLILAFRGLVTGKAGEGKQAGGMGKLAAFAGVAEYPTRVKCAVLAWHALQAALEGKDISVSTE